MPFGLLGQGEEIVPMAPPNGGRLPALQQLVTSVLPNRLEQPITRAPGVLLRQHQRLIHQAGEEIQHIFGGKSSNILPVLCSLFPVPSFLRSVPSSLFPLPCNFFCRFQGPAAQENGYPVQKSTLLGREQVVGPVDQSAQGLLAGKRGAAAAG